MHLVLIPTAEDYYAILCALFLLFTVISLSYLFSSTAVLARSYSPKKQNKLSANYSNCVFKTTK